MESSLYIESRIKQQLMEASKLLNISICTLSKFLIKKVCNLDFCDIRKNCLTMYQKSGEYYDYDVFRYRLSDEEYVLFNSIRIRFRCSISLLLLIGFLLFFNEIIEGHNNNNKEKERILHSYTINKIFFTGCAQRFIKAIVFSMVRQE